MFLAPLTRLQVRAALCLTSRTFLVNFGMTLCCTALTIACRTRSSALVKELGKLRKQIESEQRDHSSYVSYEKKAEGLAKEIKVGLVECHELTGSCAGVTRAAC